MALTRKQALLIRTLLDDWLPPVARESKLVMYPLLWIVFGRRFRIFADFKERGFSMTPEEFAGVYEATADLQKIQGCTDLNEECTEAILREVAGFSVLDAGCGRGYLVERLSEVAGDVTGCDIILDADLRERPGVIYRQGSIEALPFDDNAFDTVVSTHTLEHVQHLHMALKELRRVAAKRLIIVVPRERPYRYSFNLHLHFFPHPWNWEAAVGAVPGARLTHLGDWFYVEDVDSSPDPAIHRVDLVE